MFQDTFRMYDLFRKAEGSLVTSLNAKLNLPTTYVKLRFNNVQYF